MSGPVRSAQCVRVRARNLTVVSSAPRSPRRRADPTSPSPVGAAPHHPPAVPRHRSSNLGPVSLAELVDAGPAPDDRHPDRSIQTTGDCDLARVWGADHAVLVSSTAPTAVQALLLARPGATDEVLVARDVPVSTHAALILAGAHPVWVTPRVEGRSALATGIDPADVEAALDQHPQVRVLLLASPSYAGVCSDLPGLRSVTARRDVALVVDQSRGPHLHWHPHLAADGSNVGADAVITSGQPPLLGAPGQSLLLLHGPAFDATRVEQAVLMAEPPSSWSAGAARTQRARQNLAHELTTQVARIVELARAASSMLARVPGVHVVSAADLMLPVDRVDPCTIVLEVNGRGVDGAGAQRLMRESHDVRVDGADARHVQLVIGPGDDLGTVRRMVIAVAALGAWTGPSRRSTLDPLTILPTRGPQVMTPRAAWLAPAEPVRLERCVGRTCAELVTAYPPGIALVTPGEVLSAATVAWMLEAIACRLHLRGAADPSLATLRVVAGR